MTREAFLKAAAKYLGTPYVWGGESMAEGGMDCSGFLYNALKDSGVKVGRLTAQGYYNHFKDYEVSKSSIKEGYILFFGKSKSKITHVAIAYSPIDMIESMGGSTNSKSNPGRGVVTSNISRRKDLVAVVDICKEAATYYPIYKGFSTYIDVVFKAIGAPYGNVAKRKPVAVANDINDYHGFVNQNLKLTKLAKEGKLRRA